MEIVNSPEEWEQVKDKFKELYLLHKSPDWTLEKQVQINEEINSLVRFSD